MSMFTIAGAPTIEEGDMELIFSTTLTSSAASIATGTLPTGYKSLCIKTVARCDTSSTSAAIRVAFNSDTTASHYQYSEIFASNALSPFADNERSFGAAVGNGASANIFSNLTTFVNDHESTNKYKNWVTSGNVHTNTSAQSGSTAQEKFFWQEYNGVWRNTSAITTITLTAVGSIAVDFLAGASVFVYGLK